MMHTKPLELEKPIRGALYLLLASLSLALLGAAGKLAQESVSPAMVVFSTNFVSLVLTVPIILSRSGWSGFVTRRLGMHLLRDLTGLFGYLFFFVALVYIPLTDAVLLVNTGPIFIPLIIWVWFRRRVTPRLWWGILTGFLGVILVLQPGAELFEPATLFALASGMLVGFSFIVIRRLNKTEDLYCILFYYVLVSSAIMLPFMVGLWETPSTTAWIALAISGALMLAYQLSLIQAFRYGKPSWLSAFIYFSVVWSALLDWAIWDHIPDALTIIGTLLVIAGGVLATILGPERRRHFF